MGFVGSRFYCNNPTKTQKDIIILLFVMGLKAIA